MRSEHVEPDLITYHFGMLDIATRTIVETHLFECSHCVRTFLNLKREVETAASDPVPSLESRTRLRRAIAAELHPRRAPLCRQSWELPFAIGVAFAAIFATAVLVQTLATGPGSAPFALRQTNATERGDSH